MEIIDTPIADVKLLKPRVFSDERGFFLESWNARTFAALGLDLAFVQDNHSRSSRGTLRGIHYQIRRPQGKLVRVVRGRVYDIAVDLRRSAPTFGRWVGAELSDDNHRQLWVPPGFGHAFYVMSETADFLYKCTEFYAPEFDRSLRWDDPTIAIDWPVPVGETPLLSDKDLAAPLLPEADLYD
jgi:dTDP-4-dehydrorhamnose 3,5-epimerase